MLKGNRFTQVVCLTIALAAFAVLSISIGNLLSPATVKAQQPGPDNQYLTTSSFKTADGKTLTRYQINGPAKPPAGYELQRQSVDLPASNPSMGSNSLIVPAYDWVFGCSAVSGSMIAAYYDRNGYPNMYTGPTGGGIMPLDNSVWPTWTDSEPTTYPNNPLDASHKGVDGRTIFGSIDDYWDKYGSTASDPYITAGRAQHTWGDAIGDFMKTSQSAYSNTDGSTSFYNYNDPDFGPVPLTCADMENYEISTLDGTYGRKLFYEARGYTVTDCYSQNVDTQYAGGFSFAQYKAQIDAGHPVLINLAGHSIVGVGYDDANNTVVVHDTWDYSNHTMTWGGSYSGMEMLSVSIVNISDVPPVPQDELVYVPIINKPVIPVPFTGKVTDNGKAVANLAIDMYYSTDGGNNFELYKTVKTAADGTYKFPDTPPVVDASQQIGVEFYNTAKVTSRLLYFDCNAVTTTNKDYSCNINVHDVAMSSPANGAYVNPNNVTFSWAKRSTNTDSYWFFFYDAYWGDLYYAGNLGYVGSLTTALPYGLDAGMYYQWWVNVATPDGWGESYYYRWLGLSSPSSPASASSAYSLRKVGKGQQVPGLLPSMEQRKSGGFLPLTEDKK